MKVQENRMANEPRDERTAAETDAPKQWERPTLKHVGNVNDVFLFPGSGKISVANDDPGDMIFKPKGQG
jgi:hypothetical protein